MPDEDRNFRGALVLDFRKRWRQVKTYDLFSYRRSQRSSRTSAENKSRRLRDEYKERRG